MHCIPRQITYLLSATSRRELSAAWNNMDGYFRTLGLPVLGIILAVICFVALKASVCPPTPVRFNFVGFQQSTNGWEAVFYVTNWPRPSTSWRPEQVSEFDGRRWRVATNFNPRLGLSIQMQTNITVTYVVPGTNVPMRTVTRLESEGEGWLAQTRRQLCRMLKLRTKSPRRNFA